MNRTMLFDERIERLLEEAELFRRGDELLDKARALKQRLLNRLRKSKALQPDSDGAQRKPFHSN